MNARVLSILTKVPPVLGVGAGLALAAGLVLAWAVPPDARQGEAVRILFVHVPAAWTALLAFLLIAFCAGVVLAKGSRLADIAAETAAPLGAVFCVLGLITGALWGKPMWGAWWVWDGRLTSFLLLFLLYLGLIALRGSFDAPERAARSAALVAVVGAVDLPIIIFSVQWWSSLHQGASLFRKSGSGLAPVYLTPLILMALGYTLLFLWLWSMAILTKVREREQMR